MRFMETVIAEKYAVALLQVAKEQKSVESIGSEIGTIRKVLESDLSLRKKLEQPRLKAQEKIETLQKTLGGKMSQTMENFLRLLILKKRIKILLEVAEKYESLCYEMQNKAVARVLTAMPMTPAQKEALSAKLKQTFGMTVDLREEVKPNLIGGMIVYLGDQRMDASLLGQLQKMKQRLISIEVD
jgi:F-type H+-transporting ATPase subunit delta